MIGAKPCTDWLPPEIERDEKGFIKTGHAVADAPAWKGAEPLARAAGDEPARHLCRRRRALRLGETLRRRGGRGRHGGRGRARGPQNLRLTARQPSHQSRQIACIAHKSLEICERCRLRQQNSPATPENSPISGTGRESFVVFGARNLRSDHLWQGDQIRVKCDSESSTNNAHPNYLQRNRSPSNGTTNEI